MNFLKKFLGSSPKGELSLIPSGQFFLKRSPGSPKSASECLYTDAVASIRETSTPHNYWLVVQKAYAEGEEPSKDDDDDEGEDYDEHSDERIFLIDSSLLIHLSNRAGSLVVSWVNKEGDEGESYEFVVDETIKNSEVDQFMRSVHACCFERKYQKSSIGATEDQLKEFIYDPETDTLVFRSSDLETPSNKEEDEEAFDESFYEDADDEIFKSNSKLEEQPASKATAKIDSLVSTKEKELISVQAELRLYDPETESFALQDDQGTISVLDLGKWQYWLSITGPSGIELGTTISSKLNPVFNYEVLSFIFNYTADESVFSWLLRFKTPEDLLQFQSAFMRASWEGANKSKWEKADENERRYNLDAFNTNEEDPLINEFSDEEDENEDEEDDEDEEEDKISNLRTGLHKVSFSDSEEEDEESEDKKNYFKGSQNKNLTISYTNDRSYVTRGNKIGVFKTTDDDDLEFQTAIENLSLSDTKKDFVPTKMVLHNQDSSLIMQGGALNDTLYRMDLEKGKIVDEWKVKDDLPVVEFGPSKKFNQMTGEQTFLGISDKGLFKVDPRLSGDKLVESEYKTYATKNDFSSFGTTENGHIAVASNKGDIRLYDKLGIRAKSLIPAIGDSIKHVDISADGRWLLATCQTYLILIDLTISKGANAGSLGFNKSFGKENVPKSRVLRISPEHVAHIKSLTGSNVDFSKAYFNTGLNAKEQTIISSSGPYAITWSLKKILRGDAEPYLIKRYSSNVVADNFRFGTDKNVIIALADDVGIVQKKEFRKADRKSLAFPERSRF
ncbi:hypothetical protein WICMUC_004178 [Wickerhamomyces mucosus]|uniref:Vacuolar import and degradation protein 27 n=1 Tax=Wickerhamomyces mucosus TaxID=1378264 RepID=A0A9P8PJ41_9ASCO|nr:hypothetical protein WICMUC_004178 [Wickerhamomyces mucosus]